MGGPGAWKVGRETITGMASGPEWALAILF